MIVVVGKYSQENVGERKHLTYKSYKSVFMQKRPRQKKEREEGLDTNTSHFYNITLAFFSEYLLYSLSPFCALGFSQLKNTLQWLYILHAHYSNSLSHSHSFHHHFTKFLLLSFCPALRTNSNFKSSTRKKSQVLSSHFVLSTAAIF